FIEEVVEEVLVNKEKSAAFTEKIDKVLTNRFLGLPCFLGIMALVFLLTFTVGDMLSGYVEELVGMFSDGLAGLLASLGISDALMSLIIDGVVAGVGGILTFLPNIFVLFLALALLEDSGYMARVAYVMDGIMGRIGLSGRAFIPMLLGFGCTVPAIMASRALENHRDRMRVMLVTPFMSCSARLPIYVLFSELFFGEKAMLAAYSMYIIGLVVAIGISFIVHKADRKNGDALRMLLIELPEYKTPSGRTVAIYVWEKVKDFLIKAGTTIFVASVLLWILLNFNMTGFTGDMADSFGASLSRWMVPFFVPIGLGYWQIVVALIAGISAKEVVVSSSAILFGISNINSTEGMAQLGAILGDMGFGPLNAICMMIFCLLYIPCAATIVTIKKESGSWRWAGICVAFQLGVAWLASFLVYQIGMLVL
ncbi:MAG: ferrous iron transport protein B, partial [Firmicutes bacterium]|nr:ferrous iron transport protein B [Bacillota bacterium]